MWRGRFLWGLVITGVMAPASPAFAGDKFLPPYGVELGCDGKDVAALIIQCSGQQPYRQMSCTFIRINVSKQDAATSTKNRVELEKDLASKTDAQRLAAIEDACTSFAKAPQLAAKFSKMGPYFWAARQRALQQGRALCACKGQDSACLSRAMLPTLEGEERACKITTLRYEDTFTKVGEHRWISTQAPGPPCYVARTEALEEDPKYSSLWTHRLSETVVGGSGSTNPICKEFAAIGPVEEVCSWEYPKTGLMNCENVAIGW